MSARTARLPNQPARGHSRLTVKRRAGESLHIGDDIIVTIVEVAGGTVSVAVEAPVSTRIHRHEHLSPAAGDVRHYAERGAGIAGCGVDLDDGAVVAARRDHATCPDCRGTR